MGDFIPLEQCVNGRLYRIESRNLAVGVFVEKRSGFIGIREKFGSEYLFTEYHWDTGSPFGTVRPIELLDDKLPEGMSLDESLDDVDGVTGRPVAFDKPVAEGGRGWYFRDTGEAGADIKAQTVPNEKLFDFLDAIETRLGTNAWRVEAAKKRLERQNNG